MKILITGSRGQLGDALIKSLKSKEDYLVQGFDKKGEANVGDITDPGEVNSWIGSVNPDIVIHLAARTDVENLDDDINEAFKVNVTGTMNIVHATERIGARLIFLSTSDIFNGESNDPYKETDKPDPVNIYGTTKYWAEEMIDIIMTKYYVIRTCWLYGGSNDNKFIAQIIKKALANENMWVVDDVFGSPTNVNELARGIVRLIQENVPSGTYHLVNDGCVSRFDIANFINMKLNGKGTITRIKSKEYQSKVQRPKMAALDNKKVWEYFKEPIMDPCLVALENYIKEAK